jgi:hypothetical protein
MSDQATAVAPAASPPDRPSRPKAMLVLMLLLAGAALVNLIEFREVDTRVGDSFDAIRRHHTADLIELVMVDCDTCQQRYGLHLSLYMVAPGSRVTVPRSGPFGENQYQTDLVTNRLYALGRASEVEWVDDLPPLQVDPRPYIVASGPGGARGAPWAVAVQSPPVPADPEGFLERGLRAGQHHHPDGRPREFVLLEWPVARGDHVYQNLLIETSLLRGEPGR